MQVRELMTRSPVCCPPDMALRDVARLMAEFDCGQIPVVDAEAQRPLGVVTDRDIACRIVAEGRDARSLSARDCMTSPVVTVTPDTSLEECCRRMEARRIRRVPVVDEGGSCCGIVAQADLVLRGAHGRSAHVVEEISKPAHPSAQPEPSMATDPVCGMQVAAGPAALTASFGGETYYFCTPECRNRFNERPEDYVAPA